jgi:hypothetical protein
MRVNRTSSGPDVRSQSQLFAFARDIVDATGAAQKFCGFLDRAAGFDRGLEIVDVHLGPIGAVGKVSRENDSWILSIAGWLRFFTLIQSGDRPPRDVNSAACSIAQVLTVTVRLSLI